MLGGENLLLKEKWGVAEGVVCGRWDLVGGDLCIKEPPLSSLVGSRGAH